jgi:hypothetical protein
VQDGGAEFRGRLLGINTTRVRARGDRMAIIVLMACVASCVRVHGVCRAMVECLSHLWRVLESDGVRGPSHRVSSSWCTSRCLCSHPAFSRVRSMLHMLVHVLEGITHVKKSKTLVWPRSGQQTRPEGERELRRATGRARRRPSRAHRARGHRQKTQEWWRERCVSSTYN